MRAIEHFHAIAPPKVMTGVTPMGHVSYSAPGPIDADWDKRNAWCNGANAAIRAMEQWRKLTEPAASVAELSSADLESIRPQLEAVARAVPQPEPRPLGGGVLPSCGCPCHRASASVAAEASKYAPDQPNYLEHPIDKLVGRIGQYKTSVSELFDTRHQPPLHLRDVTKDDEALRAFRQLNDTGRAVTEAVSELLRSTPTPLGTFAGIPAEPPPSAVAGVDEREEVAPASRSGACVPNRMHSARCDTHGGVLGLGRVCRPDPDTVLPRDVDFGGIVFRKGVKWLTMIEAVKRWRLALIASGDERTAQLMRGMDDALGVAMDIAAERDAALTAKGQQEKP